VIAVPGIGRVSGLIAALALAGSAQAQSSPLPAGVERAAHTYITRAALEAPIRFLSSDLLEGRGPATRGDELARLYLQTRLEGMGYQPAFANGAWQQPFDIVGLDGTDFIGRPAGWGRQQKEQWELKKYHQPSDRLEDSWNFDGMIEDAQLAMLSAWLTAQADAMPAWKPGDQFEAARKRALAAAGGS